MLNKIKSTYLECHRISEEEKKVYKRSESDINQVYLFSKGYTDSYTKSLGFKYWFVYKINLIYFGCNYWLLYKIYTMSLMAIFNPMHDKVCNLRCQ